jgi:hypothetical protein
MWPSSPGKNQVLTFGNMFTFSGIGIVLAEIEKKWQRKGKP